MCVCETIVWELKGCFAVVSVICIMCITCYSPVTSLTVPFPCCFLFSSSAEWPKLVRVIGSSCVDCDYPLWYSNRIGRCYCQRLPGASEQAASEMWCRNKLVFLQFVARIKCSNGHLASLTGHQCSPSGYQFSVYSTTAITSTKTISFRRQIMQICWPKPTECKLKKTSWRQCKLMLNIFSSFSKILLIFLP